MRHCVQLNVWQILRNVSFLVSWDQADVEDRTGAYGYRVLGFEILKTTFSGNCRSSVVAFLCFLTALSLPSHLFRQKEICIEYVQNNEK